MLGFIKKLFGAKPAETVAEVPYKVEAKVEAVNAQPVTAVAEKASEAVVKSVAKKAPAKKTAAKKGPKKAKSKPAAK